MARPDPRAPCWAAPVAAVAALTAVSGCAASAVVGGAVGAVTTAATTAATAAVGVGSAVVGAGASAVGAGVSAVGSGVSAVGSAVAAGSREGASTATQARTAAARPPATEARTAAARPPATEARTAAARAPADPAPIRAPASGGGEALSRTEAARTEAARNAPGTPEAPPLRLTSDVAGAARACLTRPLDMNGAAALLEERGYETEDLGVAGATRARHDRVSVTLTPSLATCLIEARALPLQAAQSAVSRALDDAFPADWTLVEITSAEQGCGAFRVATPAGRFDLSFTDIVTGCAPDTPAVLRIARTEAPS